MVHLGRCDFGSSFLVHSRRCRSCLYVLVAVEIVSNLSTVRAAMPREIKKHEQIIEAFKNVKIISELIEQLPNDEFRNELDMDIILFGRSYRGKQVGPYARLLEFLPGEVIVEENTWESSIFYILVSGRLEASLTEPGGGRIKVGDVPPGNSFGEMALLSG